MRFKKYLLLIPVVLVIVVIYGNMRYAEKKRRPHPMEVKNGVSWGMLTKEEKEIYIEQTLLADEATDKKEEIITSIEKFVEEDIRRITPKVLEIKGIKIVNKDNLLRLSRIENVEKGLVSTIAIVQINSGHPITFCLNYYCIPYVDPNPFSNGCDSLQEKKIDMKFY